MSAGANTCVLEVTTNESTGVQRMKNCKAAPVHSTDQRREDILISLRCATCQTACNQALISAGIGIRDRGVYRSFS